MMNVVRSVALTVVLIASVQLAGAQEHRAMIAVAPAESLQVSVWGRGEQVVIVPGIWSLTFGFRKVIPQLMASGLSVIVIEPLGVASSTKPKDADYSLTAQGRRIGAVLDSLGVREAVFVGQSLSTSMLLRMEAEKPGRIRGLLSLEGDASEESATPGLRRGLRLASIFFRIFPSETLLRRRLRGSLENVSADKSWITPDVVQSYLSAWSGRISETLTAYRAMASSKEEFQLTPILPRLRMPVHLMVGGAEHYGSLDSAGVDAMQRLLPSFTMTKVPGAGHLLHEERPHEVVKAILRMVQNLKERREP